VYLALVDIRESRVLPKLRHHLFSESFHLLASAGDVTSTGVEVERGEATIERITAYFASSSSSRWIDLCFPASSRLYAMFIPCARNIAARSNAG